MGQGPLDIIVVPGCLPHLETWWEAQAGRLARRLAEFARLVLFDLRGTGLSDRPDRFELQQWADDLAVVLDAADSHQPAVVGLGPGGAIATLFAAAHPDRAQALVLHSSYARILWAEDYPQGRPHEDAEHYYRVVEATWGRVDQIDSETGLDMGLGIYCPSVAADHASRELWARMQRISTSPAGAVAYNRVTCELDVRAALAAISVPTLVVHPTRDRAVPIEHGYYLAQQRVWSRPPRSRSNAVLRASQGHVRSRAQHLTGTKRQTAATITSWSVTVCSSGRANRSPCQAKPVTPRI